MMVCYLHRVTMYNGDVFDLYYVNKILDWKKISNERWLPYEDGCGNTRYINIAQISDIFITQIEPIERRNE